MKLDDILIKISDYDDTINKVFYGKDVITIQELVNTVEDLYCEVDSLKEEIEDLKRPKEFDEHTAWQDQQLEEGVL